MKKFNKFYLFLVVILMFSTASCTKKQATDPEAEVTQSLTITTDEQGISKSFVTIKTIHGNIKLKFYPKDAPNTVNRIVHLIKKGFYNGHVFHRVVPGFVIQTGDPTGTGRGGSGQNLKAEFNKRKHELGTLAMARSSNVDSADSQFYICLNSFPHLDNNYTVFGKVMAGIEVVKKISKGDKMLSVTFTEK